MLRNIIDYFTGTSQTATTKPSSPKSAQITSTEADDFVHLTQNTIDESTLALNKVLMDAMKERRKLVYPVSSTKAAPTNAADQNKMRDILAGILKKREAMIDKVKSTANEQPTLALAIEPEIEPTFSTTSLQSNTTAAIKILLPPTPIHPTLRGYERLASDDFTDTLSVNTDPLDIEAEASEEESYNLVDSDVESRPLISALR